MADQAGKVWLMVRLGKPVLEGILSRLFELGQASFQGCRLFHEIGQSFLLFGGGQQ